MRREDWKPRMWAALDSYRATPFSYGAFDCVRLSADCLDAMLVNSYFSERVSGMYSNARQALRLIMREGLENLVSHELGVPVPRNLAREGDVCLMDLPRGPAIGICVGPRIAIAGAPAGVVYMPIEAAELAWNVN